jgi:hypothetical protein
MTHFKNKTSVLAFGDSHVAGCELNSTYSLTDVLRGKVTLSELDESTKPLAFPQTVATRLDLPCYNFAMSGGSNARSIRKLIEAVDKYPDSVVLFGYTSTDRAEFYYPDDEFIVGRDDDLFVQVGMQWNGWGLKNPVNDFYIKHLRPYNNLAALATIVDSVALARNCLVIHVPLFPEVFPKGNNVLGFDGAGNYLVWAKAQGFKQMQYYHYGLDAHNALADMVMTSLRSME